MSQMIDGAHDDYDALDPLAAEPPARGGRGRRGRRPVIVDDSYGEDGFPDSGPSFDDDPYDDHEPRPRPASRGTQLARPRRGGGRRGGSTTPGGGGVWALSALAALIWVGAVAAFSAGMLKIPVESIGGFLAAALARDTPTKMVVLAVMIAPLGLILQTALTARRTQRMGEETRRLNRLIDDLAQGGARANAAPGALREEADAAARAFAALEAGFAEAEERAQSARMRLESERAALAKLAEDLDGHVSRISKTLSPLTGVDGDRAAAFAEMVAAAMARTGGGGGLGAASPRMDGSGGARRSGRLEPAFDDHLDDALDDPLDGRLGGRNGPAPAANGRYSAEPARAETRSRSGGESPREVVQRLAEAAKQSLGGNSGRDLGDDIGAPIRRPSDLDDDLDDLDDDLDENSDLDLMDPDLEDDYGAGLPEIEPSAPPPAPSTPGQFDWGRLIRAANFPDSEEDRETLDALYAVLGDPEAAELLQAAEDALSSLADIGLFMEDMQPRHAPVELWRAYVVDQAREGVTDLGGVRDAHAIEDVGSALEEKADFDAAAQRFMDAYEVMLTRMFHEAPSARMAVELADTRSGRAYMLIGRALGRFG